MDPQPTLSAGAFAEIGPAIRAADLDFDDLLKRVDISDDDLADWDNPISLNAVSELFELAARSKNDDALSLELAQRFPARGTGVLGYVLLNAPTLRQSLIDFGRYSRLVAPDIETTMTEDEIGGTLEWRFSEYFQKPRNQFVAFVTATLIQRIRLVNGHDWVPIRTNLEVQTPKNIEPYKRIFGPDVRFESERTFLVIGTDILNLPMPDADVRLHKLIQQLGEYRLEELEAGSDIVDRTQDQIILLLNHGPVSLEMVARDLGQSTRSLQRRLKEEGTTFQIVLEKTRRRLTRHYLKNQEHTLTEIAFMLGFSEQSAFSRACKKWFDSTPYEMRTRLAEA